MALALSPVITARRKVYSAGYVYHSLSEKFFGGLVDPVLSLEHFRMSETPYPPRPIGGYSNATYLFETSPGALYHRDSLGNEWELKPGELVWTAAGKGALYEQGPVSSEAASEGLQIQVNLSSGGKKLAPVSLRLEGTAVPVFKPNAALTARVLAGRLGGLESSLALPEPFTLIEVTLRTRMSFSARVLMESGALLYALSGKLRVTAGDEVSALESYQAIGAQADEKDHELLVEAQEDARFVFLSGKALKEPIVSHGPFVMNTQDGISAAIQAYQRGEMGRLEPRR